MLNLWFEVILDSKIHALFVLQLPFRKKICLLKVLLNRIYSGETGVTLF